MYEINFEKRALHDLNKLDKPIKKRIWDKLQECKENPFRYLESLKQIEGFKLRVGNYRIIVDVQEKINVLYVFGQRPHRFGGLLAVFLHRVFETS